MEKLKLKKDKKMKPNNNPTKTQPKPSQNPTETQPKPNGNPMESDAKAIDNIGETQTNDGCFIFKSIVENIELMPPEVSMKFYAAIVRYGIFNTIPNLEGIEMACFNSFKAQIDASNHRRNAQKINALKGGRPRKNPTETQSKPNRNPTETQLKPNRNPTETQPKPNRNPTQTLTSNKKQVTSNKEQVTSNDDDPPTPLETEVADDAEKKIEAAEAVIVSWNSIVENVLPKVTTGNSHVMPLRTQRINIMLDYFANDMAKVDELFQKIVISPFLTGRKKTKDGNTFRARLEWLVETPENWVKVMDGFYDEHTASVPSHPECVLGVGEYINADGLRTYGSGKVIVPWNIPPRPSENYYYDAPNLAWAV